MANEDVFVVLGEPSNVKRCIAELTDMANETEATLPLSDPRLVGPRSQLSSLHRKLLPSLHVAERGGGDDPGRPKRCEERGAGVE